MCLYITLSALVLKAIPMQHHGVCLSVLPALTIMPDSPIIYKEMTMKKRLVIALMALSFSIFSAQAMNKKHHSLISPYSFSETVTKLTDAIESKNMKIFAVIDHQAAAQQAGLEMQAAQVIIFGNPKAGTPLMQKDPAFALQLPLRVLVTEEAGQVKVIYTDTQALIADSQIDYAEVENTLAKAEQLIQSVIQ